MTSRTNTGEKKQGSKKKRTKIGKSTGSEHHLHYENGSCIIFQWVTRSRTYESTRKMTVSPNTVCNVTMAHILTRTWKRDSFITPKIYNVTVANLHEQRKGTVP